jgi:hypothetical protein
MKTPWLSTWTEALYYNQYIMYRASMRGFTDCTAAAWATDNVLTAVIPKNITSPMKAVHFVRPISDVLIP